MKDQSLSITAPGSTSSAFVAEYFDHDSDPEFTHASREAPPINYLDRTQYWMFHRTAGSSSVKVTLGWRDVDCGIASISHPLVCAWAGTKWLSMGNSNATGNTVNGTAQSVDVVKHYGPYTWGNFSGIRAEAGGARPSRCLHRAACARGGRGDHRPGTGRPAAAREGAGAFCFAGKGMKIPIRPPEDAVLPYIYNLTGILHHVVTIETGTWNLPLRHLSTHDCGSSPT